MRLVLPGRIWYPYASENNTGDLKNGMFARIKKWIPAFVVVPYLVTGIINMAALIILARSISVFVSSLRIILPQI